MLFGTEHLPLLMAAAKSAVATHHVAATGHGAAASRGASTSSATAKGSSAEAPTVSAGHMALQLLLGLGVVVGVVYAGSRLVRGRTRGSGPAGSVGRRRGVVQVLGRQALGKGVSVAVVQVGERAYLLGVTPSAVRRLGEVNAADLLDHSEDGTILAGRGGNGLTRSRTALGGTTSGAGGPERSIRRLVARVSPPLAQWIPERRTTPAGFGGPRPVLPARRATEVLTIGSGDGSAPTSPIDGERPAPTWTSAIEHLRELTVRRG